MRWSYLIFFVILSSSIYAYNVTVENILTNVDGTAKVGTFTANFTILNSTGSVVLNNISTISTNLNGKFKVILDVPYFGNDSLNVRTIVSSEDSGVQNIGYVPYCINTQYIQGKDLSYFQIYNDTGLIISNNASMKNYVDNQDNNKYDKSGGTISGNVLVNGNLSLIGTTNKITFSGLAVAGGVTGQTWSIGDNTLQGHYIGDTTSQMKADTINLTNQLCFGATCFTASTLGGTMNYTNVCMLNQSNVFSADQSINGKLSLEGNVNDPSSIFQWIINHNTGSSTQSGVNIYTGTSWQNPDSIGLNIATTTKTTSWYNGVPGAYIATVQNGDGYIPALGIWQSAMPRLTFPASDSSDYGTAQLNANLNTTGYIENPSNYGINSSGGSYFNQKMMVGYPSNLQTTTNVNDVSNQYSSNGGAGAYSATSIDYYIYGYKVAPDTTRVVSTNSAYINFQDYTQVYVNDVSGQSTSSYIDGSSSLTSTAPTYTIWAYTYAPDLTKVYSTNPQYAYASTMSTFVNDVSGQYTTNNYDASSSYTSNTLYYYVWSYKTASDNTRVYSSNGAYAGDTPVYTDVATPSNPGGTADTSSGSYMNQQIDYQIYSYKTAPDMNRVYSNYAGVSVGDYSSTGFHSDLTWDACNDGCEGYVVYDATHNYYFDTGNPATNYATDDALSGWSSGNPVSTTSPYYYSQRVDINWDSCNDGCEGYIIYNPYTYYYLDTGSNNYASDYGGSGWTYGVPYISTTSPYYQYYRADISWSACNDGCSGYYVYSDQGYYIDTTSTSVSDYGTYTTGGWSYGSISTYPNSGYYNTFQVGLGWDAVPGADGYYVYDATHNYYIDTPNNYAMDNYDSGWNYGSPSLSPNSPYTVTSDDGYSMLQVNGAIHATVNITTPILYTDQLQAPNYGNTIFVHAPFNMQNWGISGTADVVPYSDASANLGYSYLRWYNIYGINFYGDGSSMTGVLHSESDPNSWLKTTAQTGLTGNKTGSFYLNTTENITAANFNGAWNGSSQFNTTTQLDARYLQNNSNSIFNSTNVTNTGSFAHDSVYISSSVNVKNAKSISSTYNVPFTFLQDTQQSTNSLGHVYQITQGGFFGYYNSSNTTYPLGVVIGIDAPNQMPILTGTKMGISENYLRVDGTGLLVTGVVGNAWDTASGNTINAGSVWKIYPNGTAYFKNLTGNGRGLTGIWNTSSEILAAANSTGLILNWSNIITSSWVGTATSNLNMATYNITNSTLISTSGFTINSNINGTGNITTTGNITIGSLMITNIGASPCGGYPNGSFCRNNSGLYYISGN